MSLTFENDEDSAVSKNKKVKIETSSRAVALQRWNILREVLISGQSLLITSQNAASVRRFQSFGLLQTKRWKSKEVENDFTGDWYEYTANTWPEFSMKIRHLLGTVKPETLLGFNNTGNVCVWPSEEVLTFYCLKNAHLFKEKTVIELGGGMTCLAGVALAVHTDVMEVELTDGNEESVSNLQKVIERNGVETAQKLNSRMLRWGSGPLDTDLVGKFDIVLCADCLFFDEGRADLVETVYSLLKPEGECIMVAPKRGDTFDAFVNLATTRFTVEVKEDYDEIIWDRHCKMLEKGKSEYDPNIHYPCYLHLQKLATSRESSSER